MVRRIAAVFISLFVIIYSSIAVYAEDLRYSCGSSSYALLTFVVETQADIIQGEVVNEEIELLMTREDIELIALITMAEAEGESEYGKRLVIDTILNRVDSSYFPNSVYSVIYQKNQFTSVWNCRLDRCYVDSDICQLVIEEVANRTNYDCLYFTAGGYGKYGTPLFKVGNHYFSSY